jgi:hypothetical protein
VFCCTSQAHLHDKCGVEGGRGSIYGYHDTSMGGMECGTLEWKGNMSLWNVVMWNVNWTI